MFILSEWPHEEYKADQIAGYFADQFGDFFTDQFAGFFADQFADFFTDKLSGRRSNKSDKLSLYTFTL